MSRLTKVYGNGTVTLDASLFPPIDQNTLDSEIKNSEPFTAAVAKLAEIEDSEENGLLVRLPCKIGDLLYEAGESEIYTYIVDEIHVEQDSEVIVYAFEYDADLHRVYQNGYEYDDCDFGKTVFLTHEEAMQALEARDSKGECK